MVAISTTEREELAALLSRKLSGVPRWQFPDISLDDILKGDVVLKNIPADIQLDYLFANRARIEADSCVPKKSYEEQDLKLTRAIFFYRLDAGHQFQRYQDVSRWNIFFFLALLTRDWMWEKEEEKRAAITEDEAKCEPKNAQDALSQKDGVPYWDGTKWTREMRSELSHSTYLFQGHTGNTSSTSNPSGSGKAAQTHKPKTEDMPDDDQQPRNMSAAYIFPPPRAAPRPSSHKTDQRRPPKLLQPHQREFLWSYLRAVHEAHTTPMRFTARENFVKLWKDTPEDFCTLNATYVKIMKRRMKKLGVEWEYVLDQVREELGEGQYGKRVGGMVGGLVPGRADQKGRFVVEGAESDEEEKGEAESDGEEEIKGARLDGQLGKQKEMPPGCEEDVVDNPLLRALRVPLPDLEHNQAGVERGRREKIEMIVNPIMAVRTVEQVPPSKIMEMLLEAYL